MRITYLLTTADAGAGTERAIFAQANSFAHDGDDVSILSVYREVGTPYFDLDERCSVTYCVDVTPAAGEESGKPLSQRLRDRWELSRLVPLEWDDQFCSASDQALPDMLAAVDCDVLVTTTPALTYLAVRFAPSDVVIVEQEHRAAVSRSAASIEPLVRAAPEIDCLVSLTDRSTEWLRAELGELAPRLETVYNSIPNVFYPQSSLTSTRILAAGRFVPQKNFAHLIQAFAEASADNPDWTLRIHGGGPQESALRKLVRTLGMESRIELVPPVPDLLAEWSKASVFASSSRSEGLPLVALEAMAAGLPLVAYDCDTGPAEIIDDGVNGLLVPAGDVGGLASALSQVMSDSKLREDLAAQAPAVSRRFAADRIHAQWKALFTELIDRRAAVPDRLKRVSEFADSRRESDDAPSVSRQTDLEQDQSGEQESVLRLDISDLRPAQLSQRLLKVADELLRDAEVGHFWVPSYEPVIDVLAVPAESKSAALAALVDNVSSAVSVILFRGNSRLSAVEWHPASSAALPVQADQADVLRLVLRAADNAGVVEATAHCDIEFWSEDEDQRLVPPRHNRSIDLLDRKQLADNSVVEVGGSRISAPALVTRRLWSAVDFPIDAVFTWVDDTDEDWQQSRALESARLHRPVHSEATSAARFRNRDELKYALRGIEAHAPWIRNIYVVTAGQKPQWYRSDSDRVRFVDHSEIFKDKSALPTFNSHAIEANLHHIDGLAEHYLYINDDTLLTRYQRPENYFLSNGLMKFFCSPTKINDLPGLIPPHLAAGMRNRALIERDFGMTITQGMLHTPYPQRRSVNAEIEERYHEEWSETVHSKFRSSTDLSLASSLSMHYAYATGRAVPGSIRYNYVPLGADDLGRRIQRARRVQYDVITLGEPAETPDNPEAIDFAVANFLEELLPIPTEFEIID